MIFSFPPMADWLVGHGYPAGDETGKAAYQRAYHRAHARWYRAQKVRLSLYLDPAEHQELTKAARQHDRRLGTFVREAVLAYLRQGFVVPDETKLHTLRLELRRIGTNINQVAHRVNEQGYVAPDDVQVLSDRLGHMETVVVEALTRPERVTDAVVKELHRDPELAASLRQALAEFEAGRKCS